MKISVIIPFYNEAECLPLIYDELMAVRTTRLKDFEFEMILMDNHSTDNSFAIASDLAAINSDVRVIRLSRNFGYQANILTGYLQSTGDAVIQLDADGEDDPALLPMMIEEWKAGHEVVFGVRAARVEKQILTLQRKFFYRILNQLSSIPIPADAGDFRLLDRKVVDALALFKEANPYLRGIIAYLGFRQKGFSYERRKRYRGVSKFSWWQYFQLAWDGITSFSRKPLVISSWLGLILSICSFLASVFYLLYHFVVGTNAPGFTTLILVQLFLAGIQLLCLGTLGAYVGRIFDEVKSRPLSIIEEQYPKSKSPARSGRD